MPLLSWHIEVTQGVGLNQRNLTKCAYCAVIVLLACQVLWGGSLLLGVPVCVCRRKGLVLRGPTGCNWRKVDVKATACMPERELSLHAQDQRRHVRSVCTGKRVVPS